MSTAELQEEEILALSSIYGDDLVLQEDRKGGTLFVGVTMPEKFQLKFNHEGGGKWPIGVNEKEIEFLPPVDLTFQFPVKYPTDVAPTYSLQCMWITREQMSRVREMLHRLWLDGGGSVVLFSWFGFLAAELLDSLHFNGVLDLDVLAADKASSSSTVRSDENVKRVRAELLETLLEYDAGERQKHFEVSSFQCKICFSWKSGRECLQLEPCRHVYCADCLKNYYEIQIADGNVKALNCPDQKCESIPTPGQVEQLVSTEMYARYDRLLFQHSLDAMSDIIYCPRSMCLAPVLLDSNETLATCPVCRFAFCSFCKQAFHGIAPCQLRSDHMKKIRTDYLTGDQPTREALERRYGRRALMQAVEEAYSEQYMQDNCKKCPSCGAKIQKIDGCNKMVCFKCRTYFCWLCMTTLPKQSPYSHFNDMESPCFNLLFHGTIPEDEEDDEQDVDFF